MTQPTTWAEVDPHVRPRLRTSALLVIDTQVDFVEGGASPIAGTSDVLPRIVRLVETFREHGRPVVHVVRLYAGDDVDRVRRTSAEAGGIPVAPGSDGSQVVAALWPASAPPLDAARLLDGELQQVGPLEWAMWKPRWSAFHRTGLDDHLRAEGVDTIVVAGCNFPNCPRATLVDASNHDYRVLLAHDATSQVAPHHLEECALVGVVTAGTDDVVAALRRAAVPG